MTFKEKSDEYNEMRDDGELYDGEELHLVPKIEAGQYCNGKKRRRLDEEEAGDRGKIYVFNGYCNQPAGAQTEHKGEGRCKFHGGNNKSDDGRGAPEHNQHNATHYQSSDPHHIAQNMDPAEEEFVRDVSASMEDRIRQNTGSVDYLDRVICRRIAFELHIVSKGSKYIEDKSGMLQTIYTEHGSHEKKSPLMDDIRQRDKDIISMMEKAGILEGPEQQKADAQSEWRSFIEQGHEDSI